MESGKGGIALIKASELIVKLADIDSIPAEFDDAIEVRDAKPDGDSKIIPFEKVS